MTYVPLEDLMTKSGSLYKLVLAASERAAELNSGIRPLVDARSKKATTQALEEIAEGEVSFEIVDEKKEKKSGAKEKE